MSRIPKWKTEKTKVKVVFRLQFNATHAPQSGWDKLFVSFIPADTGKATSKTNKANVRNGNCNWSDPIYETTRLLQDAKSRKYDEKLYKLVVAMGSSRSSILGEVIINLADFADASKPSYLSLPLIGCNYGTILNVTVQLLTSKTGFREFEQQRELSVKGFQAFSGQRIHDPAETARGSLEMEREQVYNARVKLKEDTVGLPSLAEAGGSNEDYADSAAGIDGSSNTSGSLYADKIEISSIHEVSSLKSMTSGDLAALHSDQGPRTVKGDLRGWSPDYADNELAITYEENNRLRARLEGVESAFLHLKTEANSLQILTNDLGAETQSLANQLVVELASREKLVRDVSILKLECCTFKTELEELKSATALQCFPGHNNILNHLQVKWLQGLLLLEDKIREIQNRACLGYNGSDFDFMSSDFDVLGSIVQKLKQETSVEPVEGTRLKEIQLTGVLQTEHSIHGQGWEGSYIEATNVVEEKMYELLEKLEESNTEKGILAKKMGQMECYYETLIQEFEENRHQTVSELENLRTEHSSCLYTISALQGQIEKLQQDMNEQFIRCAAESRELDSLNKELENRAITSETALKTVRWNYTVAVDRLQKDLELLSYQVLSMYETNENLAKQSLLDGSQLFPEHHPAKGWGDQYKLDIPRIQSESISMKSNFEKSTVANGISDQGKYGEVSSSDISVENKNVFHRGLPINVDLLSKGEGSTRMNGLKIRNTESRELRSAQEVIDVVVTDLSSEAQRKGIHCESSIIFEPKYDTQNQIVKPDKQLLGDSMGFEEKRTSQSMQLQSNHEAEISELHRLNMHLEVYKEVLKETMHSVNDRGMYMKEEMNKLAHQLEHSTADKELLMHELHNALDEVKILRQDDANLQTRCDDLMLKNHILEAKINDISGENSSLTQKIAEYEGLVMECGVYESKYKNCLEERNEFEDMLKNESLPKSCLQNEVRYAAEDFKTLKEEFDTQSSSNFKLQETVNYLQKKLLDLFHNMVSFNEEMIGSCVDDPLPKQELASNNFTAIVLHLEKFQQEAFKRILKLCEEKKQIEEERDIAHCSSNKTESQIMHLKQVLEEMTMKLDLSKALSEKLKIEQKDVAEQLKLSLEAEEKYKKANRELSSKLTIVEIEIQQANDENKDLAQKLHEFDNGREEHEKTRLNLIDCMQENKALTMRIESSIKEESIRLGNELSNLKEDLEIVHDNLHSERRLREELEATVGDLKLQLKDKCQQLQCSDEQKLELISLKKRVTDLETETQLLVLQAEESQRKLLSEISSLRLRTSDLEYYSAEVLYQLLCADVKVTYMKCQFQLTFIEQTNEVQRKFEELHLKHEIVVASLDKHTNAEAQLADKNVRLSTSLQSVKAELEIVAREREDLLAKMSKTSSVLADVGVMKARAAMVEADNIREKRKYEDEICQLTNRLVSLEEELDKHTNTETLLADENERLSTTLQTAKAELEILAREKECFLVKIHETNSVLAEVEDMKARAAMVEADNIREKCKYEDEIWQLRNRLVSLEKELDKHTNAETQLADENKRLSTTLQSVKAELEIVSSEREGLLVKINETSSVLADVEDVNARAAMVEADNIREKCKYEDEICQLRNRLVTLEDELEKHSDAEMQLLDENKRLSTTLHSVIAELEIVSHEKEGLLVKINETNSMLAEIEDIKARAAMVKADNIRDKCKYEDEICQLRNRLVSLEKELYSILSSKVELEMTQIIFKSKMDEQQTTMSLLERYEKELERLKEQYSEITCKLSEQILKTEEFKNLSVHLRELKDKADTECVHAHEKRESEGSSLARQDSLRIALIKEDCESNLHDMRNQLSASKDYAEEMLLKLQNALDEVEAGKRSVASLSKRNEELSMKISNMETELQTVMNDRKEMAKDCDRMQAELECTVLSLECCKEEKLKIEASLQECSEVRTRLKVELDLVKRLLASSTADVKSPKSQSGYHLTMTTGELLEDGNSQSSSVVYQESLNAEGAFPAEGTATATVDDPGDNVTKEKPIEDPVNSGSFLQALQPNVPAVQDGPIVKEPLLITSTKHIADIKDHFKEQKRLLISMDLLHKELERLKDDNLSSVIPLKENNLDPCLQSLQADLCQLDKANEHLRSIFPLFKELPDSGNALEKVLALELELAESLQMKKSINIHFQSSFLMQHNDNEAVFQSFRNINELIKDMLELKKRNIAVETELKEMQSRYSQLSLQFAEVEGERQQLVMTLKSRSPRKS